MGFPTTTGWTTSNKHGFSSFWASSKALVGSSNTKHAGAVAIASRLARKSALLTGDLRWFAFESPCVSPWKTKSDPLLAPSQCATMANIIRWFSPPESSDHGLNVGRFQDQGILSTHTHTHTHTYRVVVICFPPQAQRYGAGGTVSAMSIKDSKK